MDEQKKPGWYVSYDVEGFGNRVWGPEKCSHDAHTQARDIAGYGEVSNVHVYEVPDVG